MSIFLQKLESPCSSKSCKSETQVKSSFSCSGSGCDGPGPGPVR